MEIVGKHFTPALFRDYVASLNLPDAGWRGEFVVLHNTGAPTLAECPEGITAQRIENLKSYYERLGWHAGPHLFCDQSGIWVFSPLTAPGVHSPSWNHVSYGVEQLGDYDAESYTSGPGAQVAENAVAAVAILCHALGIQSDTIRFHKEDPLTSHKDCPGAHCVKPDFVERVHDYIANDLT